jgi:hypothetical protein
VFVAQGERDGGDASAAAMDVRRALQSADDGGVAPRGDVGPIPEGVAWTTRAELARLAGPRVADAVFVSPIGEWSDPIVSTFGFFLIRVLEREPESTLPFETARPRVLAAYAEERGAGGARALVDRVRGGYRVHVVMPPSQSIDAPVGGRR